MEVHIPLPSTHSAPLPDEKAPNAQAAWLLLHGRSAKKSREMSFQIWQRCVTVAPRNGVALNQESAFSLAQQVRAVAWDCLITTEMTSGRCRAARRDAAIAPACCRGVFELFSR